MAQYILAYLATAFVFLAIDVVWLKWIARRFYAAELAGLLREKPFLGVAAAFYCVYMLGVVVFAVAPALAAGSAWMAFGYGGMFGLCAYATYDLTNYATLRNWPLSVSLVDTAWGAALTGVSATAGYLAVAPV